MRRVVIAFLIAPLIVSVAWFGVFAVVAYWLFMIVTMLLGVPTFLLFRSRGWLGWWHAALAGVGCSTAGMAIDLNSPIRLEMYGPQQVIVYMAMGSGVGLLFWFIAIFRNAAFPRVGRALPKGLLWLVPVTALAWTAYERMDTTDAHARLVSSNTQPGDEDGHRPVAKMILQSGAIVSARLLDDSPLPAAGKCAYIVGGRSSVFSSAMRYWVLSFADESNCQDIQPEQRGQANRTHLSKVLAEASSGQ